jgi:hypothetical protein
MEQPFAKEPKQSVGQQLNGVSIVNFTQLLIGE